MNISVIIPLYNKAPYINRAIDSVLSQTIKADEIIVVDDGSTDGGGDIVKLMNAPSIRLITQANAGESAARNKGISAASNDLLGFLDADDEWLPNFLENIQLLRNNFPDCGAYAASSYTIRSDRSIYYPDLSLLPPEPWIGIIPNFFALFQRGMAFNASSIVIPKEIFRKVGNFPENMKHTPDIDLWARIAINYPIAFSPKRLVIYHQDAENRTAPKHSKFVEYPVVRTIMNAIDDGRIPEGDLKKEALEYVAKNQLSVAINNIMAGNTRDGKKFLSKCKFTKNYKKKWLFWRIWSFFPSFVPQKLMKIRQNLRGSKEYKS